MQGGFFFLQFLRMFLLWFQNTQVYGWETVQFAHNAEKTYLLLKLRRPLRPVNPNKIKASA